MQQSSSLEVPLVGSRATTPCGIPSGSRGKGYCRLIGHLRSLSPLRSPVVVATDVSILNLNSCRSLQLLQRTKYKYKPLTFSVVGLSSFWGSSCWNTRWLIMATSAPQSQTVKIGLWRPVTDTHICKTHLSGFLPGRGRTWFFSRGAASSPSGLVILKDPGFWDFLLCVSSGLWSLDRMKTHLPL